MALSQARGGGFFAVTGLNCIPGYSVTCILSTEFSLCNP